MNIALGNHNFNLLSATTNASNKLQSLMNQNIGNLSISYMDLIDKYTVTKRRRLRYKIKITVEYSHYLYVDELDDYIYVNRYVYSLFDYLEDEYDYGGYSSGDTMLSIKNSIRNALKKY